MSTSSELRGDVEVNVVSSPESSSRNASPEPDNYRIINRITTPTITCFPVIKTSEDDKSNPKDVSKANVAQKTTGSSTNFSISSILSRTESSPKKNGYPALPAGIDPSVISSPDSAMLSR